MTRYPLSPHGVFRTIQGEGCLLGVPMVFVRLAGCSVGCPRCDTDYTVAERADANEIVRRVINAAGDVRWVWLTGGEPTDHDLTDLLQQLHNAGFRVALATAGVRQLDYATPIQPRFLSVSPHDPARWVQKAGDQLNLVPGLNGFRLADFDLKGAHFAHQYVTPCDGKPETLAECLEWVYTRPGWKLNVQAHKSWGLA
jgi:7-carboxy-7-deazaguanine synthase